MFGHTVGRHKVTIELFPEMLSVELIESDQKKCRIQIDSVCYPDILHWMLVTGMQVEK